MREVEISNGMNPSPGTSDHVFPAAFGAPVAAVRNAPASIARSVLDLTSEDLLLCRSAEPADVPHVECAEGVECRQALRAKLPAGARYGRLLVMP